MEKDFIQVYKEWLDKRKRFIESKPDSENLKLLFLTDSEKKKEWDLLPGQRKQEITRQLVREGILPHAVLQAMDVFDARVIGI
jgi:hypothetical protein